MIAADPRLFGPRLLVLDTETTGLDPKSGDRVVEIGCIELAAALPTGREYHVYLNPERTMPPGAEAVHGLSSAFLAGQPRFADIAGELCDFIGEAPIVAHNAAFDIGFLDHELGRCGRPAFTMARAICTVELARSRFPGAKHSLDALCQRFGVDRSARVKHGALLDAQLLAQVFLELVGGRQTALSLISVEVAAGAGAPTAPRLRAPRPHTASPEELAAHAAFVARMSAPVWPLP